MPAAQRKDPYRNFNFLVEIDGTTQAGFTEVVFPISTASVIEYREGGEPSGVRKLPGRVEFSNVILKSGVTDSREMYLWWNTVLNGNVSRRNMSIVLLDEARKPVKRWNIRNAWPAKYQPSDLNAKGNEVVIETLEIANEGIELA
jgi:phage tail-like protein